MVQGIVYTSDIEELIISKYKKKWNKNKMETILKIIREFNKMVEEKKKK